MKQPIYIVLGAILTVGLTLSGPRALFGQVLEVNSDTIGNKQGVGHAYESLLSESVNPATGAVELDVQFSPPPSRGFTLPFSIRYLSSTYLNVQPTWPSATQSNAGHFAGGGWAFALPQLLYQSSTTKRVLSGFHVDPVLAGLATDSNSSLVTCHFESDFIFTAPDGGPHPLNMLWSSYSTLEGSSQSTPCGPEYLTGGDSRVVASLDAPNIETEPYPHAVTVQDNAGLTYFFSGYGLAPYSGTLPDWIRDRNGNKYRVASQTYDPQKGTNFQVVDSSSRNWVSLVSSDVNGPKVLTVGPLSYTLAYTPTNASYAYPQQLLPRGDHDPSCYPISTAASKEDAISAITLPNGKQYHFYYGQDNPDSSLRNSFGLLSEVIYPSGAWVKYTWKLPDAYNQRALLPGYIYGSGTDTPYDFYADSCVFHYSSPVVATRQVGSTANGPAERTETYSYATTWGGPNGGWSLKSSTVSVTDNVTGKTVNHGYTYLPVDLPVPPGTYNDGPLLPSQAAVENTETYYDFNSSQPLRTLTKTWYDQDLLKSLLVQPAGGVGALTTYQYYGPFVSEVDEYDAGASAPTRKTKTSYLPTQYAQLSLPCKTQTTDGNDTVTSEADLYYDGAALCELPSSASVSSVSGLDPQTHDEDAYGPGASNARFNITRRVQVNPSGHSPTTTYTYDSTGQVVSVTDPCGNDSCDGGSSQAHTTTYSYADNFSDTTPSFQTNSYRTHVNQPILGTSSTQYRYSDGQVASATDVNGQTTSFEYSDPLLRQTAIRGPSTNTGQPLTTFQYDDTAPNPRVIEVVSAAPDPDTIRTTTMDGLSRVAKMEVSDDSGTITTDTVYNSSGQSLRVSNSYRSGDTPVFTTYDRDALSRPTRQIFPDGSTHSWVYSGFNTSETDEKGATWNRTYNAFGQLTGVVEPGTGAQTTYTYDGLGNLTKVVQAGVSGDNPRTRTFLYDSLSRLITTSNPESGTTCYGRWNGGACQGGYDVNGNLLFKTDANGNGNTVAYQYDALDRMTLKTSPDMTAYFFYDQGTNGKGRLTGHAKNGVSGEHFYYDPAGRLTATTWCKYLPNNGCQEQTGVQVQYDLAGNIDQLTYPDARVVQQTWTPSGRLGSVTDVTPNGTGEVYFSGATGNARESARYWPSGALQSATYGNGVSETVVLNNRFQISRSMASTALLPAGANNGGNLWDRQVLYGSAPDSNCGNGTNNNGNICGIVDRLQPSLTQSFGSDALNRLITASRQDGAFNQTYNYDSFGNMLAQDSQSSIPAFDRDDNRSNRVNLNGTFQYDAAGRLVRVPNPAGGAHTITYEAEGFLRCIDNCQTGSYLTDALGQRSYESRPTYADWPVYLNGQVMTEFTDNGQTSDYIYANGRKIAKVSGQAVPLHLSGDACTDCGGSATWVVLHGADQRPVQAGDVLALNQYTIGGSEGGAIVFFKDAQGNLTSTSGLTVHDQDGQQVNCDEVKDRWHARHFDLSAYQGQTIAFVLLGNDVCSAGGHFDIYFNNVAIVGNGMVSTIYSPQPGATFAPVNSTAWPGRATNTRAVAEPNSAAPISDTHYYLTDHLGTTQMELSSMGLPVWEGQFTPFGQEIGIPYALGPQPSDGTSMHFKFTGTERDQESGLDYFGARYYGSYMGRFMSPDEDDGNYADPSNPQSWNLYSYVQGDPLNNTDPDGHDCIETPAVGGGAFSGMSVARGEACKNSLGRQGIYVNGTVDVHSITVKNVSGNLQVGYDYTSYDGKEGGAGVSTVAPPYGPLEGPDNLAGANMIGNTAGGVVSAAGKLELDLAGLFFPVTHFAVSTLSGMNSTASNEVRIAGIARKPGSLGQFGSNRAENKIARDIVMTEPRATRGQVHKLLQEFSQSEGRPATFREGLEYVREALGLLE